MSADRVTAEELAEVDALDAAATDGPWIVDPNAENRTDVVSTSHRCAVCYVPDEESPDGDFIARMRTLGPMLAREVQRLTEEATKDRDLIRKLVSSLSERASEVDNTKAAREALREKARALLDAIAASTSPFAFGSAADDLRAAVDPAPPEPTPDENFAALKRMYPALASLHERCAAKHGVHPWDVSNEMLYDECPAMRPVEP